MRSDIKFYDTSSLLLLGSSIHDEIQPIMLSTISLEELEKLRGSPKSNEDTRQAAASILRKIETYPEKFSIQVHKKEYEAALEKDFEINNKIKVLSDAVHCNNTEPTIDSIIFVTNDVFLKQVANLFFGDGMIQSIEVKEDYTGFLELVPTDDQLVQFYSNPKINVFNCLTNQYLLLRDANNEIIDTRVWTGNEYRYLKAGPFSSSWFGNIQPFHHDIYQQMLFDSLISNTITLIRGPSGSGKSTIALAYLMQQLQRGKISKIIIFCNTVATLNSAKLGFYPGDKNAKLLDSQIGHFLDGKFGGRDGVNQLINDGLLELIPLSDIRGYDTSGMNAGVYITEAQNMDSTLMKLALQRIGQDCICIIDGDNEAQVDMRAYEGERNGMRRASKAFRGHDIYGEIKLQNIYRSQISQIAELI